MRSAGAPESTVGRVRVQWFEREARHFAEAQTQRGVSKAEAEQLADRIIESASFPPFEVYPENGDAFRAFTMLEPQWEYPDSMGGGRLTVPLSDVEAAVRLYARRDRKDCMRSVIQMLRVARGIRRQELEKARAK